jgi:hypothetical protein
MAAPPSSRSLVVVVFSILVLGFLGFALSQILTTARFITLQRLAEKLETGDIVRAKAVAYYAASTDRIIDGNYCRYDIIRAGVSATLADVDRLNSSNNRKAWNEAVARADRLLLHAIGCMPTDGNYWVRLAMVRWTKGEKPDELARLLQQSAWLAPAEKNVLAARFFLWNRVSVATLERAKDTLQTDLMTTLVHPPPWLANSIVSPIGLNIRPYVARVDALLPAERHAQLVHFGLALNAPK